MPAWTSATSRASPSMASPRMTGVTPRLLANCRRGFERHLRRGDETIARARQARIARLRGFIGGSIEPRRHRLAAARSRISPGWRGPRRRSKDRPRSGPSRSRRDRRPARRRSRASPRAPGTLPRPSRPPLMAERCFRTQLISAMVAPQVSSARVTARLSSSETPAGRQGEQRRRPARHQAQHQIVRRKVPDAVQDALRRFFVRPRRAPDGSPPPPRCASGAGRGRSASPRCPKGARANAPRPPAPSPPPPCRRRPPGCGPWAASAGRAAGRARHRPPRARRRRGRAANRGAG